MTNQALNPNNYLKCFHSDTYLLLGAGGIIDFNNLYGSSPAIGPLHYKDDVDFLDSPMSVPIPSFIKRINLRVFTPEFVLTSNKFIAGYNLVTLGSGHVYNPKMMMLDGTEVEVYGFSEIKKIRIIETYQPVLLQIAMFK